MNRKYIFIITALLFCLVSCSDNPAVRARYKVEKAMHQAERALEQARLFKTELNEKQLIELLPAFENVLNLTYQSLDTITLESNPVEHQELTFLGYQAVNRVGQLHYALEDYNNSINTYQTAIDRLKLPVAMLSKTYINLAQSFHANGMWDSTLSIYNKTLERFHPPLNESNQILFEIFNLPINIYNRSASLSDKQDVERDFAAAENYYQEMIDRFPTDNIAIASRSNLARLYDNAGMWELELEQLGQLEDPTKPSYLNIITKKAEIFANRLNRYDTALVLYQLLKESIMPRDSVVIPLTDFEIARIKMKQGKYDEVRQVLTGVKKSFPNVYSSIPGFQFTYARSFELDDKWVRAESEYNLLIEKYRGTEEAMTALLFVVDYFRNQNREREYSIWFKKAEDYLSDLVTRSSGRPEEASFLLFKADLYARCSRWDQSVTVLESIFSKFPASQIGFQSLLKASEIYRQRLDNPQKADSLDNLLRSTYIEGDKINDN